jgi:hypothetical protein
MNSSPETQPKTMPKVPSLIHKIFLEATAAFHLTLYLGTWFCAITFLSLTGHHEVHIPLTIFGLAFIKAGLCSKFMMISLAISPLDIHQGRGIIWPLIRKSLLYLLIVLVFSCLEVGVDGWIHGKAFISSVAQFGGGDPLHILSLAIVYWLIIAPFLVFNGIKMALGQDATRELFYGAHKK